jgi:hypothetical protein
MNDPVSLAPNDVIDYAKRADQEDRVRQIAIAEKANKLEEERRLLQKYVYDSSNPSPIVIAIIVLAAFAIIYVIYLIFVKPCMSGEWVDIKGNVWLIKHNILNGNVVAECTDGITFGKVSDNFVEIGDLVGVWNYGNTIIFIDGPTLERVL